MTDRQLQMHHALHCARQGIGEWPEERKLRETKSRVQVNLKPFALPVLAGVAALILAKVWPLNEAMAINSQPINAWQLKDIEEIIEELKKDEYLEELVLKKWEEQTREMKNTNSESSDPAAILEAGDRLESQIKNSVSKTESVLEQMSSQVALLQHMKAENAPQHLVNTQDKRLSELMKQAKNMQLSWQPPKECQQPGGPSNGMKTFDQNQLQKLSEALEESLGSCSSCTGNKPSRKKGTQPSGKPGRGKQDADMSYGKPTAPLALKKLEALPEARDMILGEKLETQFRAPDQEGTTTSIKTTGQKAAESDQASGAIWKMKLRPDERQFLYRQSHE